MKLHNCVCNFKPQQVCFDLLKKIRGTEGKMTTMVKEIYLKEALASLHEISLGRKSQTYIFNSNVFLNLIHTAILLRSGTLTK